LITPEENDWYLQRSYMKRDYIDSIDRHPITYNYEVSSLGINCDPPLYLLNKLTFAGKIRKEKYSQNVDVMKGFSSEVWFLILISLLIYIFLNCLTEKFRNKTLLISKIFSSFYTYLLPFINCGDNRKPFTIIYLFWLISLFPLVEIFKNDLLANLVALNETKIETIQQLIDSNNRGFSYNERVITKLIENPNEDLKEGLEILETRTKTFRQLLTNTDLIETSKSPEQIAKFFDSVTLIDDELNIQVSYEIIRRFYKSYIATEKYVPVLISPICYRPKFQHKDITQNLFV